MENSINHINEVKAIDTTKLKSNLNIVRIIFGYCLMTALTYIIALSWNNVLLKVLKIIFPNVIESFLGLLGYAIFVTIIGTLIFIFGFGKSNFEAFLLKGNKLK